MASKLEPIHRKRKIFYPKCLPSFPFASTHLLRINHRLRIDSSFEPSLEGAR